MDSFTIFFGRGVVGAAIVAAAFQAHADQVDSATCGAMTIADQCRISWSFSRTSDSYYSVQQFDPQSPGWRTLIRLPEGTPSKGTHDKPVEAGYLYRVLACDDAEAKKNCSGSTMVWAPFIQPEERVDLIPSRVELIGSEARFGKPVNGAIAKDADWLTQVTQYNVYLMENAIARASITDLPDMTPVADITRMEAPQPIDQVQSNVYSVYLAEQGRSKESAPEPKVQRGPHEHPERHPQ